MLDPSRRVLNKHHGNITGSITGVTGSITGVSHGGRVSHGGQVLQYNTTSFFYSYLRVFMFSHQSAYSRIVYVEMVSYRCHRVLT